MPKQPAILFYVDDWLSDEKLRLCSLAARGLWIDLLSLMHKSDRRGFLQQANGSPLTPEQIASVSGCSPVEAAHLLQELIDSGAASVTDTGVIYNRRMVRDARISKERSKAGKKGMEARYNRKGGLLQQNSNNTTNKHLEMEMDNTSTLRKGGSGETRPLRVLSPGDSCLPGDNPELHPTAKRIVRHYQDTVKPAHPTSGEAVVHVIGLLKLGNTESVLKLSCGNYLAWCQKNDKQPQHRKSVGKFFEPDGPWADYTAAEMAKPTDVAIAERQAKLKAERQRDADEKAAAAALAQSGFKFKEL